MAQSADIARVPGFNPQHHIKSQVGGYDAYDSSIGEASLLSSWLLNK